MSSTEQNKITVYFSERSVNPPDRAFPTVVIVPDSDDWNDFRLRTKCKFRYLRPDHPEFSGNFHLAFMPTTSGEGPDDVAESIRAALKQANKRFVTADELPQFFSLQVEMENYRSAVRTLGIDGARLLLLAVHDLVAAQSQSPRLSWIEHATATRAFHLSFMRNADSVFAYYHASSILEGLERESLEVISQRLHLKFQLPTFAANHSLMLAFDRKDILPKRIAALIGKNGTGKSQALRNIASSLLRNDERLRDIDKRRPMLNRVIAIGTPGETDRTFPRRPNQPKIPYHRFSLRRSRGGAGAYGLGKLILQLKRSAESIAGVSKWKLFLDAIERVLPIAEIAIPARKTGTGSSEPVLLESLEFGSEQVRLERFQRANLARDLVRVVGQQLVPLSSGQTSFVAFAAQLCLLVENGSLVLIDEPETHLHPNLISQVIVLLDNILSRTGSIAIIATHSVHLIRELPRSQVHVFREPSPGIPEITTPRLKTLGADLSSISSFVFGDTASEQLQELQTRLDADRGNAAQALDNLKDELPSEAVMELSRALGIPPSVAE